MNKGLDSSLQPKIIQCRPFGETGHFLEALPEVHRGPLPHPESVLQRGVSPRGRSLTPRHRGTRGGCLLGLFSIDQDFANRNQTIRDDHVFGCSANHAERGDVRIGSGVLLPFQHASSMRHLGRWLPRAWVRNLFQTDPLPTGHMDMLRLGLNGNVVVLHGVRHGAQLLDRFGGGWDSKGEGVCWGSSRPSSAWPSTGSETTP